ncbi:pilus assembly protein PilM [Pseudomonas rubra]|uniref:Pilus assembly protein PilM n=1 Tax=Pseudomonas rubra TaxID=2942627 RepID=A0ABT5P6P3_9PSED|nr:pilus assembly protein PilM [Pseudomonas rubra]MDD1013970.1 pilus assembly protein PilM [Pseudomonas rubra]MDD1038904.1 pilus assembly protein PilM [Pseudomonas rubra]MDD1154342.1 pilus assembly protein PilM [Pseudomonas rubra]
MLDGWIADPEVVGQALMRALQRSGSGCRLAAVGLPASRAINKQLALPAGLSDAEVAACVRDAAEQFIPFDLEDIALDYKVLERAAGAAGGTQLAVIACHRGVLDALEAAFEVAGLSARVLEVDSQALQRATTGDVAMPQGDEALASSLIVACGLAMGGERLNLLPWRERRDQLRIRRFQVGCVGVVLLAAVVTWLVDRHGRSVLQEQAHGLTASIDVAGQPEVLMPELRALEGLQVARYFVVDMLEQLDLAMPDGVYFTALGQEQTALRLTGMAPSASAVVQLAAGLSSSSLISSATVQRMSAFDQGHEFELQAILEAAP